LANLSDENIITIDGKCLRRSIDTASNKAATYRVSAWSRQNSLVLGQVKVDEKSNEITTIPKLLSRLDIAKEKSHTYDNYCENDEFFQQIRQFLQKISELLRSQPIFFWKVNELERSLLFQSRAWTLSSQTKPQALKKEIGRFN
jgi:predicted transposase YbfD/YdcC